MWVSLHALVVVPLVLLALVGADASPGVVDGGPSPPIEGNFSDPDQILAAVCPTNPTSGTASNGTASNGTASNGTASNGTASNGTASNGPTSNHTASSPPNASGMLCEAEEVGSSALDVTTDRIQSLPDVANYTSEQLQYMTPFSLSNPQPRPVYKGTVDPPIVGEAGDEEPTRTADAPVGYHDQPTEQAESESNMVVQAAVPAGPSPSEPSSTDEAAPPQNPRPLSIDTGEIGTSDLSSVSPLIPLGLLSIVLLWRLGLGRLFSLPLAALYARMQGSQLEDNPRRRLILDFIQGNPGASIRQVSSGTEISYSTVKYHIKVLEYHRHLVSRRIGKRRCFYTKAQSYSPNDETRVMLDNHPLSRGLVSYVWERPGVIQKDICTTFGLWPSHGHALLKRLEGMGLIEAEKKGRSVHYFPAEGFHGEQASPLLAAGATA